MEREEAQELVEVIERNEPSLVVECSKRWFSRRWRVWVVRDGRRCEYRGVYHYWLERALVKTFCRPLGE